MLLLLLLLLLLPLLSPLLLQLHEESSAQLLEVSRQLFAEKGFEGTSVEEIAARAEVSKPVVYEHFGGKEGIYAVVVDREIRALTSALSGALDEGGHPKVMVERSALAREGFFNNDFFVNMLRAQMSGQGGYSFQLWTVMNAVLWHASWIEGNEDCF